jgi:flagellar hook-associated protein 2
VSFEASEGVAMTITSIGVGSGLDVESIITKLVAVERQPISTLQTEASTLQSKLSSMGKVQSYLSALQDAARKLSDAGTWKAVSASASDASAMTVAASDGATAGAYNVTVSHLAMAQSVASGAFAGSSDTVGSGTLNITLGSWNADDSAFTPKTGATPVAITIGDGDTLAAVRDKINAAGAGVVASIVNDASGARLSIRSKDTGVENAFQITVNDATDAVDNDANGLSRLAYDPANSAAVMTRYQPAQNAQASINGLDVSSASNTLSNVLDGLSLTLAKESATPVTVTVSQDNTSMGKAISDFAKAYNDVVSYLREQTAYNADTKKGGSLQGDSGAVALLAQLRKLAGSSTSASTVFTRLTDIGLEPQKDGTLKTTQSKVDAALAKLPDLKAALATLGTGGATDGLARQFKTLTDTLLGSDGLIETRTEGLNARIKQNSDRQAMLEDHADQFEQRVRARYEALDTQMAGLSTLSTYIGQQIANWNKA